MHINSNEINYNLLSNLKNEEVIINHKDEDFYFKFNIKEGNSNLAVHINGAIDYSKKRPPLYQRSTWSKKINASCIFIDDKTLHNVTDDSFNTAWLIGTEKRHYLKDYSEIIKMVQTALDISNNDVYYWGSSAGGTSAIALATLHTDSTAIANNPQTNILTDYPRRRDAIFNNVFSELTEEVVLKNHYHRLTLAALMKEYDYVPRTFYIQNNSHKPDLHRHFNEFIKELENSNLSFKNITFWLYHDPERGHGPLDQDKTLEYLHTIMNFKHL